MLAHENCVGGSYHVQSTTSVSKNSKGWLMIIHFFFFFEVGFANIKFFIKGAKVLRRLDYMAVRKIKQKRNYDKENQTHTQKKKTK